MSSPMYYEHQVEGIRWLTEDPRRALCDDAGLGKTLQTLTTLNNLGCKRILVLCPNMVRKAWRDQLKEWEPDSSFILVGEGLLNKTKNVPDVFTQREAQIRSGARFTVMTYELTYTITAKAYFKQVKEESGTKAAKKAAIDWRHLDTILSIPWDALILDEAHKCKNRKGKTFEAVKLIVRKGKSLKAVIPLTANPILSKGEELWPILHLLRPDEYSSFWKWAEETCETAPDIWSGYKKVVGVKDPDGLKESLRHLILRRMKDECLDLPEKTFVHFPVTLEKSQRAQYNQMKKEFFVEFPDGSAIEAPNALARDVRLKQLAISPDLLVKLSEYLRGAKIDALEEILEMIGDQKFVIFSQFAQVIKRLVPIVNKVRPGTVFFTGEDAFAVREKAIDALQLGSAPGCMTTFGAGGVGLTMTAASVVITMDLLWVPALNAQAIDRVYRIGQKNAVTVYNIVAEDTIEARVIEALERKDALFNAIIPEATILQKVWEAGRAEG